MFMVGQRVMQFRGHPGISITSSHLGMSLRIHKISGNQYFLRAKTSGDQMEYYLKHWHFHAFFGWVLVIFAEASAAQVLAALHANVVDLMLHVSPTYTKMKLFHCFQHCHWNNKGCPFLLLCAGTQGRQSNLKQGRCQAEGQGKGHEQCIQFNEAYRPPE
jgi:hypothetical protein